jgi:hypothetical protein
MQNTPVLGQFILAFSLVSAYHFGNEKFVAQLLGAREVSLHKMKAPRIGESACNLRDCGSSPA